MKSQSILETAKKSQPSFLNSPSELSMETPLTDLMLNPSSNKNAGAKADKTGRRLKISKPVHKSITFQLKAPKASSVKLAADFTDWEKAPLEMVKSQDGTWVATTPLLPGQYSYRFIVDGEWCDDPLSNHSFPNPYGTANAVRQVI